MLTFTQLLVVAVVVAAAKIAFSSASGAFLKTVVDHDRLLTASSRFESTTWSAAIIGPVLGGAAMGLLGPVVTVSADAVSYLLSALGITAIGGHEPAPPVREGPARFSDLVEGWRYIWSHRALRALFFNVLAVNGLIMAPEPVLAFMMLGRLGFPAWQYGLAFAVPCVGGLIGSRFARRVVTRFGERDVLLKLGVLRTVWPLGLAFIRPGVPGLLIVMVVELGLILCVSVYSPVVSTYRLQHTDRDRLARVLSAWSVSTSAALALLTALWGVLADVTTPRAALVTAGVLLLATPLLLPRGRHLAAATSPTPTTSAGREHVAATGQDPWPGPAGDPHPLERGRVQPRPGARKAVAGAAPEL